MCNISVLENRKHFRNQCFKHSSLFFSLLVKVPCLFFGNRNKRSIEPNKQTKNMGKPFNWFRYTTLLAAMEVERMIRILLWQKIYRIEKKRQLHSVFVENHWVSFHPTNKCSVLQSHLSTMEFLFMISSCCYYQQCVNIQCTLYVSLSIDRSI